VQTCFVPVVALDIIDVSMWAMVPIWGKLSESETKNEVRSLWHFVAEF
jgi:hypothetical protein